MRNLRGDEAARGEEKHSSGDDVPLTCRTCTNAKHAIRLAVEAYRLRREMEEIRLLTREGMRRCGAQSTMPVKEWLKEA